MFFFFTMSILFNGKNHGLTENLLVFTNKNGGVPVSISPFNPIPEGGACLKEIAA